MSTILLTQTSSGTYPEIDFVGASPSVTDDGKYHLAPDMRAAADVVIEPLMLMDPDSVTTAQAIGFGITCSAAIDLLAPEAQPAVDEITPALAQRLTPIVAVSYDAPIISGGKPYSPTTVARFGSTMTLTQGNHAIHTIPDPDPGTSSDPVYNPPPAAGQGDARWTVRDLPDPSGFSGDFYWLGTPSSADGTSGIESACQQWAPHASGPSWHSVFPYKPSVRQHVYYGPDGSMVTETAGVRFNDFYIEHMWADFGSLESDPFTWVIVGIVMDFPSKGYVQGLLDVGKNPVDGGAPALGADELAGVRKLSENYQGGTRPGIHIAQDEQRMFGDENQRPRILTPFNHTHRPHMWFGVWNGSESLGGSYSTAKKHFKKGSLPASSTRYVVLGRQSGYLSRSRASHLVIFEMRYWHSALNEEQLDELYGHLSSTWRFQEYH